MFFSLRVIWSGKIFDIKGGLSFVMSSFFISLFIPLPFIPIIPLPHKITTLLSMPMSPLSFFFVLCPLSFVLPPPKHTLILLFISLSVFCLLIQFVHYIPHMTKIIWYLYFSDWLISFRIVFSRSIHAITKGKNFSSFSWLNSIRLCKCPIVVLSTH